MNGAESLVRTLIEADVEVCFANPGTSEMHFVSALDRIDGIRSVLCLFEGVVTGAADAYGRLAGKPAVTLLHLGPGLGNGVANLHNGRKSDTPIVNVVGEHALWHIEHDAPLTTDIVALAEPVSHWVRTAESASSVATDAADAVAAARTGAGQVATLILPANTAWEAADGVASPIDPPARKVVSADQIEAIVRALDDDGPTLLLLGGSALRAKALEQASRIAQQADADLLCETFKTRLQRGRGRVDIAQIPYDVDQALELLSPYRQIVLIGARPPVAFFAYPDKPSKLYPESATLHTLAVADDDIARALDELVERLDIASTEPVLESGASTPAPSDGPIGPETFAALIARHLPEQAIVIDESITGGRDVFAATRQAPPHDWLEVCGGSIGGALPMAVGAAVACPERKVLCLDGDGSAMYTVQALWTMARESLDVTNVILANGSYAILKHELSRVQAEQGERALRMMELDAPELDWVALAAGMGVPAVKASTVTELDAALAEAMSIRGPRLIEARFTKVA